MRAGKIIFKTLVNLTHSVGGRKPVYRQAGTNRGLLFLANTNKDGNS
jgi:hypothetical protein